MSAYVMVGVDVETDIGSFTPFYEGVKKGVPILLDMFDKHNIKGTFYFTGDSAKENPGIAKTVASSASEVGCHSLYHETVGDELFPIPGVKPLLPEEVFPRIKLATELVEKYSGVRPVSFRCPRLWGSTAVMNALERLGYATDASYPMYFYREQFAPYHPSRECWTQKGDMKILEIPNFADMLMESKDPPLERDRDQWPLFRTKGAEYLMNKINGFIDFAREKSLPPVIALYIHPWEFIPAKREYHFGEATVIPDEFITYGCGDIALREMNKLVDLLKKDGAVFVAAKEIAAVAKEGIE
ncbi:MAG: polysaccharide deacetylase family protein [Firmicutes bacterium]|nr:polysaccharide deacetylase family protein [Bacillota bacterium]